MIHSSGAAADHRVTQDAITQEISRTNSLTLSLPDVHLLAAALRLRANSIKLVAPQVALLIPKRLRQSTSCL